ncbi:MAG: glycosyltransferase family 4 protein [Ferruginibacter sp.]
MQRTTVKTISLPNHQKTRHNFNALKVAASAEVQETEKALAPVVPFASQKIIRITTVPMALKYLLPGQMNFMKKNGYDVLMISADGKELPDVIANEKCRHKIVPMTRRITPLQDLKCLIQLIRIFSKEKPDIVHSHTPKAGLLGMIAAKICGVKTRVHTVAGLPMMVENGMKFKLLKLLEKITYAAATNVWPNSGSLLNYITDNRLTKRSKLQVIGKGSSNGINLSKFNNGQLNQATIDEIKTEINYSSANTYLLFMGRLVKDKGIVELVNAFTALQPTRPGLRLLLVGDFEQALDPLPHHITEIIKNNDAVIHVPWTNKVEYFMNIADHFVFPSHREGFPNVLLQAGAMKLPIICSSIPGNIDIVQNKQTGLLFQTANETSLREAIEYAVSQKENTSEMAQKLNEVINAGFQHTFIWQNLLFQYKRLQHTHAAKPGVLQQARTAVAEWAKQIAYSLQQPSYHVEKQ